MQDFGRNTFSLYDFLKSNTEKPGGSKTRLYYKSVQKSTRPDFEALFLGLYEK